MMLYIFTGEESPVPVNSLRNGELVSLCFPSVIGMQTHWLLYALIHQCVYVNVYTHVCMCMFTPMCVCACVHRCVYVHVYTDVCMCMCTPMCVCACVHRCVYVYIYTHVCMCVSLVL